MGKRDELINIVRKQLPEDIADDKFIASILDSFCSIREASIPIHHIFVSSNSAKSKKPNNLILNWKKIITNKILIATVISEIVDLDKSIQVIKICLAIWIVIYELKFDEITLDNNHALCLIVFWSNRDHKNKISEDLAYLKVCEYLLKIHKPEISKAVFAKIIDDLLQMKCLKLNEGVIHLVEGISVNY